MPLSKKSPTPKKESVQVSSPTPVVQTHQSRRHQPLAWLALAIILVAVGVFAASMIYPTNEGEFPRNPDKPGTIGYILRHMFGADGSAGNSASLAGVAGSGYLKNNNCADPNHVWIGIDQDGKGVCGPKGALLAVCIGHLQDTTGGVQVKKKGANWGPAVNGVEICTDDEIQTNNPGKTTIKFASDASILRLDNDTKVTIQPRAIPGKTVAQTILENGRLWGRILSPDDVYIGGGGVVAGVRGTSIAVTKNTGTYNMAVYDSKNTTKAAVALCEKDVVGSGGPVIPGITLNPKDTLSYPAGTCPSASTIVPKTPIQTVTTLNTDEWVQQNMAKDITYLANVDQTELTNAKNNCGEGLSFWKSLVDLPTEQICRDNNIVAFADSRLGTNSLYVPLGQADNTGPANLTSDITTGQVLIYNPDIFGGAASLVGKRVEIFINRSLIANGYILNIGSIAYSFTTGKCAANESTNGNKICQKIGANTTKYADYDGSTTISIDIPNDIPPPSQFILGAANVSGTAPLQNTITGFSIKNITR